MALQQQICSCSGASKLCLAVKKHDKPASARCMCQHAGAVVDWHAECARPMSTCLVRLYRLPSTCLACLRTLRVICCDITCRCNLLGKAIAKFAVRCSLPELCELQSMPLLAATVKEQQRLRQLHALLFNPASAGLLRCCNYKSSGRSAYGRWLSLPAACSSVA